MSTLIDRPLSARHRAGKIQVEMESGLEIAFPVQGNPRLEGKPPEQLGAPGSTLSIGSAVAFA